MTVRRIIDTIWDVKVDYNGLTGRHVFSFFIFYFGYAIKRLIRSTRASDDGGMEVVGINQGQELMDRKVNI